MKLEDIAKIAGVSKSAVSIALNNKAGISEKTKEHILKIVKKYNYVPLRKVKNNKNLEKGLIHFVACKSEAIITDNYQNQPFFNELIGCFTKEMEKSNYSLVIFSIDLNNLKNELNNLIYEENTSGIILLGTNLSKEKIKEIIKINIPIVIIDTCFSELDMDFIVINNYQGGYKAAKNIIDRKHTIIGYAQSDKRIYNFEERKKGFFHGLNENNLEISESHIYSFTPMTIEISNKFSYEDFIHENHPTAIFCENDYIAISLIKTLNQLKINVPNDISVIGFDNISESKVISPELATIDVNKNFIAKETLKRIIDIISQKKKESYTHTFINVDFIKRNSLKNR